MLVKSNTKKTFFQNNVFSYVFHIKGFITDINLVIFFLLLVIFAYGINCNKFLLSKYFKRQECPKWRRARACYGHQEMATSIGLRDHARVLHLMWAQSKPNYVSTMTIDVLSDAEWADELLRLSRGGHLIFINKLLIDWRAWSRGSRALQ